jgi:hypothetical protein
MSQVVFRCKRRGFCPSGGVRRMAECAALLIDEVLPEQPIRQWVLSFPFQLRLLFASRPQLKGKRTIQIGLYGSGFLHFSTQQKKDRLPGGLCLN